MSGSEAQGVLVRLARQTNAWGLPLRLVVLALVVLAAFPALAALVSAQRGVSVWHAAALAGAICYLGAALAMAFTAWLRGPQGAMYSVLLGMVFRMGLPLGAGLVLSRRYADLEATGFFGLVLGFYLVTLVAETLLVLPLVQDKQTAVKV